MSDPRLLGDPIQPKTIPLPARQPHEGQYVRLCPVNADADVSELYRCSHSDETRQLWTYLSNGPFASKDEMHIWLKYAETSTDPLRFTVYEKQYDRRVGMTSFMRIKPQMRCLELGSIWYAPAQQRTKVNTECIYLMLCESFDRLGYRRVEWKCNALNERSRQAALRLGFQFEGIFRQHMVVKGHSRDTAWFAMLGGDWPQLKQNMEHWLYSDQAVSLTALNKAR